MGAARANRDAAAVAAKRAGPAAPHVAPLTGSVRGLQAARGRDDLPWSGLAARGHPAPGPGGPHPSPQVLHIRPAARAQIAAAPGEARDLVRGG